ncbi:hypothetical protein BN7_3050 [Wickerhamomyces ciferrii]|uniref:GIY-YIG domain-containing protein n=1 Tax=Wickerhamomyces ciferrii (strain ATCC 14091 / BCRC 22168 / CBS 111 / JCM 3599 / NBRC 0793 / NRRL Y-1031 F-60-10) TaxID=1206466 RepID=K0KED8_WICCF|nr:uncharacterized protein BN7_3050 [Wickerhamomyces ciferrii]CCH43500.1 hypothetical protein BN7_3050 [Wickerhamomyces ciferrii]
MPPSGSQGPRKKLAHSVPKFYGCYLLRSIPKQNSFYIGSTPDPVRRLRQHNGELKAGAYKTKRKGFRPWEMIMIVHGFPNKIAALQVTRITTSKTAGRSVHHKLGNVRLLLNAPFFNRMNLKVQIFNSETYKIWCTNKFGINLSNQLIHIDYNNIQETDEDLNIESVVNFKQAQIENDQKLLTKFKEMLQYGEKSCIVCDKTIDYIKTDTDYPLVGICYHDSCDHISHLSCLTTYFREQETEIDEKTADEIALQRLSQRIKISEITKLPKGNLIPQKAKCPSCDKTLIWSSLVRYSTMIRLVIGYDGKEPITELEELEGEVNDKYDDEAELELTQ